MDNKGGTISEFIYIHRIEYIVMYGDYLGLPCIIVIINIAVFSFVHSPINVYFANVH